MVFKSPAPKLIHGTAQHEDSERSLDLKTHPNASHFAPLQSQRCLRRRQASAQHAQRPKKARPWWAASVAIASLSFSHQSQAFAGLVGLSCPSGFIVCHVLHAVSKATLRMIAATSWLHSRWIASPPFRSPSSLSTWVARPARPQHRWPQRRPPSPSRR